jgi:hypothetical protein
VAIQITTLIHWRCDACAYEDLTSVTVCLTGKEQEDEGQRTIPVSVACPPAWRGGGGRLLCPLCAGRALPPSPGTAL